MSVAGPLEVITFAALALVAVGGALGMATTMSMFRSGVFLMASFIGVAGLFLLLSAELLGWLQIMMYAGGMLVMILFMVLFGHDPGGAMMANMKMSAVERLFSRGVVRETKGADPEPDDAMHGMTMTTPLKRAAAALALAVAGGLAGLFVVAPSFARHPATPDARSAERVGDLLMGRYMAAFEGAGLLILLGIFGAVFLSRRGPSPDRAADHEEAARP